MLTPLERERYTRQIMIDEIGEPGQEKLKRATVFVAGAGGLGSPVSILLAVAGVGEIRIVDNDTVEMSNLNRQILHQDADVDRLKVDSAREKLSRQNPAVKIDAINATIGEDNVLDLANGCDVIVDAMDNIPTRYALNHAAVEMKVPLVHGAVRGFEGRAMTVLPGRTACLRCMHRGPVARETFPVIGVTPAVIAAVQATEVIKVITGAGDLLTDRLLVYEGLAMTFDSFKVKRNPDCDHCGRKST